MKKALKRRVVIIAIVIALCMSIALPIYASTTTPQIRIDGEFIGFPGGQLPVLVDGRTLVPLRDVMEPLGFDIEWTPPHPAQGGGYLHQGIVTLTRAEWHREAANMRGFIQIEVGSTLALYRLPDAPMTSMVTVDVPARIINGRTMVPVRVISELTGYTVDWDGVTQIVDIITDGSAPPPSAVPPTPPVTTTVHGIETQTVIATHADGTQTVRTNTGHELRIWVGHGIDTQRRLDSCLHVAMLTHDMPDELWAGAIFNITRVTSADLREQEDIEDLGNIFMPYAGRVYIYDLPDGRYRITLIHRPDGFVLRNSIYGLTFRDFGEQVPTFGTSMNELDQPFTTATLPGVGSASWSVLFFSTNPPPQ